MIGIGGWKENDKLTAAIRDRLSDAGVDTWFATGIDHSRWAGTEIFVSNGVKLGNDEFTAAPRLRGVVSPVVGYDWIDVRAATRHGVAVVNCDVSENSDSMAEATILLVLALLYRLHDAEAALKRGDWAGLVYGGMLRDKTVGLIGLGGISRAIIKRLQGWNCRLLVHSRSTDAPPGVALAGLDELTAASDVIVVITSLSAETHHLLNRERLAKMKPHAILVNTSRGAIIEEDALVEILQAGKIAGAALDAFEVEPLAVDHPLRKLTNVILTPHAIGHTREAAEAVPLRAMENVLALAAGTLPASCKNPEVAANWPRIATT